MLCDGGFVLREGFHVFSAICVHYVIVANQLSTTLLTVTALGFVEYDADKDILLAAGIH
jgi:hypothetical protein